MAQPNLRDRNVRDLESGRACTNCVFCSPPEIEMWPSDENGHPWQCNLPRDQYPMEMGFYPMYREPMRVVCDAHRPRKAGE